MTSLGDLNGDTGAFSELAIGLTVDALNNGLVFVVPGGTLGSLDADPSLSTTNSTSVYPSITSAEAPYPEFGHFVLGGHDLDGDGSLVPDLLVTGPGLDAVEFFQGETLFSSPVRIGAYQTLSTVTANTSGDVIGDWNGDGRNDFILGTFEEEDLTGLSDLRIYFNPGDTWPLELVPVIQLSGSDMELSGFGNWVSAAEDMNNDGLTDIVVGAQWDGSVVILH